MSSMFIYIQSMVYNMSKSERERGVTRLLLGRRLIDKAYQRYLKPADPGETALPGPTLSFKVIRF